MDVCHYPHMKVKLLARAMVNDASVLQRANEGVVALAQRVSQEVFNGSPCKACIAMWMLSVFVYIALL